ncbi:helix-turn-helix transcriptional regulator [Actinobacillus equuli subsp. haemolyticus]|uniref:Helix-turn-helix transcriptional regulator n=1 Tax=Actinobacillus equuli subsp. equuli TaxID=202947 RepID=A0A9X4G3A8_ACTEU|nr:helix-turn-helix transcriptional regulator [Actinobacillus equuli]MDE8034626.1 helix-turn-helix transcriptional regulator [Actinobacillus equuli subsp. equuli]MDG4948738.1 helix-turn-helix transcriptional regulator [Actinobacillus equuli subsp. haemolyticus]WGE63771.1 helix-turn-helix transcriptional regulator [Actinobacillus equuli subsp. haemolyticus]
MSNLSSRLSNLLAQKKLSMNAFAKMVGVSQRAIAKIVSGETRSPKNIIEIANALGVSAEWLKTGKGEAPDFANLAGNPTAYSEPEESRIRLDVLDVFASAGNGTFVGDLAELTHAIEFDPTYFMQIFQRANSQGLAIINVTGDSMEPTINSGDLLFVDTNKPMYQGDGIYVFSYGEMLYVKRLQLAGDRLLVISDNQFYHPWEITKENEVKLSIHGKVEFSQMKIKKLG